MSVHETILRTDKNGTHSEQEGSEERSKVANHVQIELGGTCLEKVLGKHPVEFPSQHGRDEHENVHEIMSCQAIDELLFFDCAIHVRLNDSDEQINRVTYDKRGKH